MNYASNFAILKEWNISTDKTIAQQIHKEILILEHKIFNDNYDFFGLLARKIVEKIFIEIYKFEKNGKLVDMINALINNYPIPTSLKNALHTLRQRANEQVHSSSNNEQKYIGKFQKTHAIQMLDAIHKFCKYTLIEFLSNKDNDELDDWFFSDEIYNKHPHPATRINKDLANSNYDSKALLLNISQLAMAKDYKFSIPTYQREYKWNIEKIQNLLSDIQRRWVDGNTHYIGAIAVAVSRDDNILKIVDGQQRITTTLLILKAFWIVMKEKNVHENNVPNELREFIPKLAKIYISKKILTSQQAVDQILSSSDPKNINLNDSGSALPNYKEIYEWLSTFSQREIVEIYNTFVTKFETVTLFLDVDAENEMDIFENLNTRGEKLEEWDLIKNYLFNRLDPAEFLNKEDILNKYLVSNFQASLGLQNQKNINVALNKFFVSYLRLMSIKYQRKIFTKKSKIYNGFKEMWSIIAGTGTKFSDLEIYLIFLNKNLKLYLNLYLEFTANYVTNAHSILHKYKTILDFIGKEDILPILLHLGENLFEFNSDYVPIKIRKKTEFLYALRSIENYLIRVAIVRGFGFSQSKKFDEFLLQEITASEDSINFAERFSEYCKYKMVPVMPTIDEFVTKLSTDSEPKHEAIMNMLIKMENYLRDLDYDSSSFNNWTREHILAQDLNVENYDENNISKEAFNQGKQRWMNSIGNSLILSQTKNSKLGKKAFLKKLDEYEKSSYIAKGKNGKIEGILDLQSFNFSTIEERSKKMALFASEFYKDYKKY